ncbi:MAG TPA: xylulokinase [Thermoprotei archaeon]|nr:xylulokinase [Thermoprotei archaeon]
MRVYKPPYLLGIDSGTSACKAVLFTLDGKIVGKASVQHKIYYPQADWAEQDPEDWWRAASQAIKTLLKETGVKGEDIIGVSVDSQREAVVPLDKEGKVLYRSIIWLDNRTIPQQRKIESILSRERILEMTGLPSDYIFSASKILWIKENLPEVFNRVHIILFPKDYIIFKLTGAKATDYSMASRTMLLDLRKGKWSEEICEAIGVPVDILPEIKGSWEVIGEVSREASEETGLKSGTPVAAGGGDRPCEALGAGVFKEGSVCIGTGTGTAFEVPLSEPRPDKSYRFDCCYHVAPNMYEYEGVVNSTGASLQWLIELLSKETSPDFYALLEEEASKVSPGCDGLVFYPYLWGARLPKPNPKARGVFLGILRSHTRAHLFRAVLEGVAYQYLGVLKALREMKVEVSEVFMVGGETRLRLWNKIKADVTGLKIKIPEVTDAAALGSAILAGLACGAYSSVEKAVEEAVRIKEIYEPDLELHEKYLELYEKYEKAYQVVEKVFSAIY